MLRRNLALVEVAAPAASRGGRVAGGNEAGTFVNSLQLALAVPLAFQMCASIGEGCFPFEL